MIGNNQYEDALKSGSALPVENEYDQAINQQNQVAKTNANLAATVGLKKNPSIAAEAITLSNKLNLPADFIERNIDQFREQKERAEYDYDDMVKENPYLADWIQDPNHVAISKGEIDKLKKIENNSRMVAANKVKPFQFTGELTDAAQTGYQNLVASGWHLGAAYGKIDIDSAAENIAAANKRARDLRAMMPSYAEEFSKTMEKEGNDVNVASQKFIDGKNELYEGRILQAMKLISTGGAETVGEAIDMLASALIRPKGLLYSSTESLAFSAPAVVTGIAGAKAGAMAGAVAGPKGAAVGATVGMGAGTFAGSVGVEIGAWMNSELEAKGFDLTNPEDVKRAYGNKELVKSLLAEAERKGVTTAAVDSLFSLVAGKFISKGGVGAKAIAKDVGVQMAGEAISEGAGQFAAKGEVDVGESLLEGLSSLGSSVTQSFGAAAVQAPGKMRDMLPKNPISAAKEIVKEFNNANESVKHVQSLKELGDTVKELNNTKNAEGAIQKLVDSVSDGDDQSSVFFQSNDWDNYWNSKGESPIVKAAELGDEVAKAYQESKENGSDFKIPLGSYLEKLGPSEDFDGLLSVVKATSDGKNLVELKAMDKELSTVIQQVAKEAEEQSVKNKIPGVKSIVKEQLMGAGKSSKEAAALAQVYEANAKVFSELLGYKTPLEYFNTLNLKISKGTMEGAEFKKYLATEKSNVKRPIENKPEYKVKFTDLTGLSPEARTMATDEIEIMLEQMKSDIATAEGGRSALIGVEEGRVTGRVYDKSTFPDWYKNLKVKNKDDFNKALASRKGPKFERIRDTAIDLLVNGYMSKQQGAIMPSDIFRELLGMPAIQDDGEEFTAFQFAGPKSITAPLEKLNSARIMEIDGIDSKAIRKETGWFKAKDGKWRYEISDDKARFKEININNKKKYKLNEVLSHDELFNAYPTLSEVNVEFAERKGRKGGHFDKEKNTIKIMIPKEEFFEGKAKEVRDRLSDLENTDDYKKYKEKSTSEAWGIFRETPTGKEYRELILLQGMTKPSKKFPSDINTSKEAVNTMLHEIQHFIQDIEGFARGGSAKNDGGVVAYKNLLGEIEARDTEARKTLSEEERLNKEPSSSVLGDIAIIKWNDREIEQDLPPLTIEDKNIYKAKQQKLLQGGETPRGMIDIGQDYINITLLEGADPSTFIHETGHMWLEQMSRAYEQIMAMTEKTPAQEQFIKDMETTLKYLGVESFADIKTEQHELWARSVETYFGEGKAPTPELQSAFNRFKAWIISVYRSLRNIPDVNLTDDVRQVMDRLLAAEESVKPELEDSQFFNDAKSVGLSDDQAAAYEQARNEWRLAAEEQITKELMDDLKRKDNANYKKEYNAEYEKQLEELSNQRVYKAVDFIMDNTKGEGLPTGINPATLPKEVAKRMPKRLLKKDGYDAQLIAGLLGYESVSEMGNEIADNPSKEDAAKMNADAFMRERYPDRLVDADLEEHARSIMANEKKSQLLRRELEMIVNGDFTVFKNVAKSATKRLSSTKDIQNKAKKTVSEKLVSDIKPHIYKNAERKSARLAGEALVRGDFDATFENKRKELLNYELFRASNDAKEKLEKFYDQFDKINQADKKIAKSRDINFVYAARAIMSKYGLSEIDDKTVPALEQLKQYDPFAWESIKALSEMVDIPNKDYEKLTFAEMELIHDTVASMWDMARSSKEIEIDGKRISKEEAKAELIFNIGENTKQEFKAGYNKQATNWEKVKVGLLGFKSSLRRVESFSSAMDRGITGPFRKYIWNPISEASDKYRTDKTNYMKKFKDLTEGISGSITKEPIYATELGYEFKDKGELLGALLHTGNESNLRKLLLGRGWATEMKVGNEKLLSKPKWDSFISRMFSEGVITKSDMDYVQGVWDLMEELKPGAQKAHKKLYGFYFDEITANEIETPFGVYRGGYARAITDSFMVEDQKIREEQAAFEQQGNSFMFPATGKGFTMKRVENYTKPLVMDLRLFPQHLDKVLRFTHIQPKISEVSSIVMDKDFRNALYSFDPTVGSELLVPWLQRAANQKVETPVTGRGNRAIAWLAKKMRTNAGMQTMAANLTNAIQQFTGLSIAAVKVKPHYLRDALWSYTRNSKNMSKDIMEKSGFMRERLGGQLYEAKSRIDEITLNPTKLEKFNDFVREHAYFFQSTFQGVVDNVVWSAAYDESVAMGMPEDQAVKRANSVVRETQGSFNAEDISEFEAGNAFKRMFTMFYSYFNMQANLLGTEFSNQINETGLKKGAGRMLYVYTMGFMIPAVLSELIVKSMAGKIDEDDDDEYMDDFMAAFFGSQVRSGAALVPIAGQTFMATMNTFNDKSYDDRISTSPAISMLESATRAPYSIYKAISDDGSQKRATRDLMTLIGLASGIPVLPLSKPINYMSDVSEGNAQPTGPIDFGRGLITGKSGQ